jgi:hypothetical protein
MMAALVMLIALPTAAQESAKLAPPNTAVFIELPNLAKLRAKLEQDPVVKLLRDRLPANRRPEAWEAVKMMMGMSGEEIFDRYFGKQVVVISERTGDHAPSVVLSKVDAADFNVGVERLQLSATGNVNDFKLYETTDGKGRFAFHNGWMAMASDEHAVWLKQVLGGLGKGPTLADDATFKKWVAKLPAGGADDRALAFARGPEPEGTHVLSARRGESGDIAVHYAGSNEGWRKALEKHPADAGPLSFGPTPNEAVAAMALNLHETQFDANAAAGLDRLLNGRSFQEVVWSKLAPPAVVMMGSVPGEQLDPATPFIAPSFGVAMRMKDKAVAGELDQMLANGVLIFNVVSTEWKTPAVQIAEREQGAVKYRVAHFGAPVAQRFGRPALAGMGTVCWAAVGDWYVITSQEPLMKQAIAAVHGEAGGDGAAALGGEGAQRGLAGGYVRTQPLAAMLSSWLDYVKQLRPALAEAADERSLQGGPMVRAVKGLSLAAELLKHYRVAAIEFRAGDEEGVVLGQMQVKRAQ